MGWQGAKVLLVLELIPIRRAVTYPTCDTESDSYAPWSLPLPHISPAVKSLAPRDLRNLCTHNTAEGGEEESATKAGKGGRMWQWETDIWLTGTCGNAGLLRGITYSLPTHSTPSRHTHTNLPAMTLGNATLGTQALSQLWPEVQAYHFLIYHRPWKCLLLRSIVLCILWRALCSLLSTTTRYQLKWVEEIAKPSEKFPFCLLCVWNLRWWGSQNSTHFI